METRDRSDYPDFPHPGRRRPSEWIAKPNSIVVIAISLFILIFGFATYLGYLQIETSKRQALTSDKTTANLLADLLLQHNKAMIGILQSYAHQPLFIEAVKKKDVAGAYRHLSDLKKNAEIDLTFVTDTRGILWMNFPVFPEAIGKDLSGRDWYQGVSSQWKPYISTVFKLIVEDKPLAVAVCVPVFDEKGRPIGILANSQRLGFLNAAIERVPFSPYTTVTVTDRTGKILYMNNDPHLEKITDYRFFRVVEPSLKAKKQQIEMNDPQKDQEKQYLTVVPIGEIGWTIIIERSLRDIYRSDLRRFIEIGAVSCLLFILIVFLLIYLRKAALFKKTEELLQAELKLVESEEQFRATFEQAAVGIAQVGMNGRWLRVNQRLCDIVGYTRKELLQSTFQDITHPADLKTDLEFVRQILAGEIATYSMEKRYLRKDRSQVWVNLTVGLVRDHAGAPKYFVSVVEDISVRKRAQEELDTSQRQLSSMINAIAESAFLMTPDGTILLANEAVALRLGTTPASMTGKIIYELIPPELAQSRRQQIEQGIQSRVPVQFEDIRMGRNILNSIYPVLDADCVVRQLAVFGYDITDRVRAETALCESKDELHRLIKNMTTAFVLFESVFDDNGIFISYRFVYINEAYERLTKVKNDEVKGRTVHDVWPNTEPEWVKKYGEVAVTGVSQTFDMYHEPTSKYYHCNVYRPGETQDRFCVVFEDVTSRKQAEDALHWSETQLKATLEATADGILAVDNTGRWSKRTRDS